MAQENFAVAGREIFHTIDSWVDHTWRAIAAVLHSNQRIFAHRRPGKLHHPATEGYQSVLTNRNRTNALHHCLGGLAKGRVCMLRRCMVWAFMSPLALHAQSQYQHVDVDPSIAAQTFNLALGDGALQRVFYLAPARARATIIMLPGGSGDVGIERSGDIRHVNNFVVRTRDQWVALGYAVMIPDTPDHGKNLRGQRSSPAYASLVETLVDFAHKHHAGPVFLLGTSQGSIAAMNGAAHARPGSIAGVVLTESVSILGGSHETVFDADPGKVRVPALVVANDDDHCDVAPPQQAPKIVAAMVRSPDVSVIRVHGGIQKSASPCGSLTPHGYYGIETTVIANIATWLAKHQAEKTNYR